MFHTLAQSTEPIPITVGGVTHSATPATSMAAPIVTQVPDRDCRGVWVSCSALCIKTYYVTVTVHGGGTVCPLVSGATGRCVVAEGSCSQSTLDNNGDESGGDVVTISAATRLIPRVALFLTGAAALL